MEGRDFPVVLSIAGSDSGGGAGVQADLKTFQALSCRGICALTAVTAQNTREVRDVQGLRPDIVVAQLEALFADTPPRAAKTGMLYSGEIIAAVEKTLTKERARRFFPLVVDPVAVATSGGRLLREDALNALCSLLLQADLITPNLPEAEVLLERNIRGREDMKKAARELHVRFKTAVLLKGGHCPQHPGFDSGEDEIIDVFFDGSELVRLPAARVSGGPFHGTGCALSAAVAAYLARGFSLREAIEKGRAHLLGALKNSIPTEKGSALLHHAWNLRESREGCENDG